MFASIIICFGIKGEKANKERLVVYAFTPPAAYSGVWFLA